MKPGPKPKGKVKLVWSPHFAYAIGLLTADGCLSKDGRHIDLTSKDRAQIISFKKCLGIETKISLKYSGAGNELPRSKLRGIGSSGVMRTSSSSVFVPVHGGFVCSS